jgi:GT2 family glycosyltransferase
MSIQYNRFRKRQAIPLVQRQSFVPGAGRPAAETAASSLESRCDLHDAAQGFGLHASHRMEPVTARGKFLYAGDGKFYVRGVTYGAFEPDPRGKEYHDLEKIERDFADMAAVGINAVRIPHTVPPRSLLDAASRHGLRVMVGLSAEQYVGYLIDRKKAPDVEGAIREKVRSCSGHPAILCYSLGNEIQAPVVRWLGRERVERYLRHLYEAVKEEEPFALVTYVNYPTTEYLQLPFLDLVSFNVYLEDRRRFVSYLARLQNIAGGRPLLMSEIGLDSLRNGEEEQARSLAWQLRASFESGCAGAFVFAWTDEWWRAGAHVDDWKFGLTDRERRPKPALHAARRSFASAPPGLGPSPPRVSVVVCTYNGHRTIRECLEGLSKLDYPDFEVLVVDDGSTDPMTRTAEEFGFNLIRTENLGLSSARNIALEVATGEIIAYIDDDAYPDPDWLTYLVSAFRNSDHVGIGGPNIPPPGSGWIADCVANAPGNPTHVLLTDETAEHIPGCNMAFRKDALAAVGGFDPQFRAAGDDVDLCWRIQEKGWTLGFHPAAQVWHHRRGTLRAFWKQQVGYGRAESLLEKKWPQKYNGTGHATWAGRMYGDGLAGVCSARARIYHGVWGTAPFQSIYGENLGRFKTWLQMPEWYLVILTLLMLAGTGVLWRPLLLAGLLLPFAAVPPFVESLCSTAGARFESAPRPGLARFKLQALTAFLHVMQPFARLYGRLGSGHSAWTRPISLASVLPVPRKRAEWSESWEAPERRLGRVEAALREGGERVHSGGGFERWDLEVRCGIFGGARMMMAVEDHGGGRQLVRSRVWPRFSAPAVCLGVTLTGLAAAAGLDHALGAAALLGGVAVLFLAHTLRECGAAVDAFRTVLERTNPAGSCSR